MSDEMNPQEELDRLTCWCGRVACRHHRGPTTSDELRDRIAEVLDQNFNPDQYPIMAAMFRDYAQAVIDEFGLTVETKKQTYPAPGAEQFEHATVSYDHEHSQWQATDEYGNDISDAYNDWIRNLPVEYSIVGKWKKHE